MRVSLQIDGDASGAEKAAQDASAAVVDLGKQTDATSKAIEDGFKKASGSVDSLKNSSQAAGAANDNNANAALGLAGKLAQVAGAAAGADSALAKSASGAVTLAKAFGDTIKAVGAFNVIGALVGLAVTAVTTFNSVIDTGSAKTNKALDETTRLVGAVRDAYREAGKVAFDFYTQSQNITQLQAQQALATLRAQQLKDAQTFVNKNAPAAAGAFTGSIPGEDFGTSGLAGALFPDQSNQRLAAFKAQFDALQASINAGAPDFAKFRDDVAAIGLAAAASSPELAALANELIKATQGQANVGKSIAELTPVAKDGAKALTDQQKSLLGISTAGNDAAGSFDRLAKAMDRQSAAQAAEAQTAGKSAGEAAKLRTEFVLTEAALQAGAGAAQKYADKIAAIAARAGEAAQKLAQARLSSDIAFQTDQLGRNQVDASVADQIRGAFGNNADQNSAVANAIRLNETLKDVKATTLDLASGAFRDFRSELQQGKNAFEALGIAGVNALNKIIDKLADKALDAGISKIFGSILGIGGGGTGSFATDGLGGFGPTAPAGFDTGGYTGPGGKYDVAGIVHRDEYVFDKDSTNRLGVGFLDRLRGYADGGLVGGGPSTWGGLSSPASPNGASQGIKIDVGVSVDDDGKLKAVVKSVSMQAASDTLTGYVQSPDFIQHVAGASKVAQSSRLL